MPGVVGLITSMPRKRAESELRRMLATIYHEPFYRVGTWVDEDQGVYVGWSVRRDSFADGMPLQNAGGDLTMVFSGEEFPEPGTAQRLKSRGRACHPEGPAYLAAMCEDDPAFPAGLNGRFHGIVADGRRGTATIFNDRFGLHRLYYHQAKTAFYFSAEAKAILAVRPGLRRVDARGLGEFVACGCVLENRTLFPGIHVLPPASAWRFRHGALESRGSYFKPQEWEEQPPLQPEEYYRAIQQVFTRNLPRYFEARERIGISLTGGLDTRMIMAWRRLPPRSIPCYTFGGMFRDSHDVRVAKRVARVCDQPHEVVDVGRDFLDRFWQYAERSVYLSDGCVDLSRAGDLYVNERARQIAPIRMTGNYGSEVLRGVRAFKPQQPRPGLFRPELLTWVRHAAATYDGLVKAHPVSFAVFRQAPWHHYGLLALEQTQLSLRSPFLDNDLVRTVFRAPASALKTNDLCLRLIADGHPTLSRILTDRGLASSPARAVRAAGLLARSALQFQFKAEYAYDYGMPQWVAGVDHLLKPLRLERLFLGRHKCFHFRIWYRDALAAYVRDMLLDSRTLTRPYLERRGVEAMVQGHTTGRGNYTTEIHKVLTLELLHRLFVDTPFTADAGMDAGMPVRVAEPALT